MHISRRTDYSFRLLMLLGIDPDRTVSVAEAAERLGLSANHLAKIAQDLAQAGIVVTVRGRSGGIRLTEDGINTTIGDVVRTLEPLEIVECFDPEVSSCTLQAGCRLSALLEVGLDAFLAALDDHTIGDLCARPTKLRRLLT
jgi:Rrf2 family nitric oxide-sensitive transcriptional repressor